MQTAKAWTSLCLAWYTWSMEKSWLIAPTSELSKHHDIWPEHESLVFIIPKQLRLRQACTKVQIPLSLRCSHAHSMDIDEDSVKNIDLGHLPALIRRHWRLFEVFAHMQNLVLADTQGLNWPRMYLTMKGFLEMALKSDSKSTRVSL